MSCLKQIYKDLCLREEELLKIIGNTNMSYYTIQTMQPEQLRIIYTILNDPSLEIDNESLYWATHKLNIWEKYKAKLEISFLTAQIKAISAKLDDNINDN
jgi:hypothetical protein